MQKVEKTKHGDRGHGTETNKQKTLKSFVSWEARVVYGISGIGTTIYP